MWVTVRAVSPEEIEKLSKRFKKLDLDNSGSISVTEFKTVLPELMDNPLVPRVITIFDTDGNGELDFQGSLFHVIDIGAVGDKESLLNALTSFSLHAPVTNCEQADIIKLVNHYLQLCSDSQEIF